MAKSQQITVLTDVGVGQLLESARDQFQSIIQRSQAQAVINWQKEAPFARQILLKDNRLLSSTQESLKNAITNIAAVGLTLNPIKQHATILPRWNERLKRYEASLVVMYRGLIWLANQAGVTDIVVDVVYSTDKIEISRSDQGDKYNHVIAVGVPRDGTFSRFIGCYVAARMPGSKLQKVEWVPAEDIMVAREKSESYRDKESGQPRDKSPWVQFFDEMAKKVALKRASKRWEEAVLNSDDWKRFQTAVALDNAMEGVIPQRVDDIPGTAEHIQAGKDELTTPVEKLSMKQISELEKLAEQVAPNSDEYPNNTGHYLAKIARTYRQNKLADVEASKFDEIKGRINEAIEKQKAKKAADPKAQQQGKGEQGKSSGQAGEAKGGGSQTTSQGSAGGGSKAGGASEREPGSDDDAGDPDRQIH